MRRNEDLKHRALLFGAVAALFLFAAYASAAELVAPIISVAPDTYYPLDETLYIEGAAPPKKTIDILFEKPGSQPIRVSAKSNSNGEWFFSEKLELTGGEWMVRARTSDDPPSDWSNPRIIRSVISGFIIGSVKIKYLPLILVLAFLFIVSGSLFVYSVIRIRTIKRQESERKMEEKTEGLEKALRGKEQEEAKRVIEENFADLRERVLGELEHLEKYYREGKLTKEEEEHRQNLLREMREAEKSIEKEVRDIG